MRREKHLNRRELQGLWGDYEFQFFISYAHADKEHIDAFEKRLRRFLLPRMLERVWTPFGPPPKTLKRYFRDRRTAGSSHSIDEVIQTGLQNAAGLVVFCSPNSAKSEAVNEEITLFRKLHQHDNIDDRIFPIILDGEPGDAENECFPPALTSGVNADGETDPSIRIEPIAADAREQGDGPERAFYKVIAGMLGINASVLMQEDVKRERAERYRRSFFIAGATALTAALAIGSFIYMWKDAQRWESQDDMLAEISQQEALAGNQRNRANDRPARHTSGTRHLASR